MAKRINKFIDFLFCMSVSLRPLKYITLIAKIVNAYKSLGRKIKEFFFLVAILLCFVSPSKVLANVAIESRDILQQKQSIKENPLLQDDILVKFDQISPAHFKPAVIKSIEENQTTVAKLLEQKKYTWDNFVTPLNESNEKLSFVWATIQHLNVVIGNNEVRKAYEECIPLVTKHLAETAQNVKIYAAINKIYTSTEYANLNPIQKKIISNKLRDFHLNGVSLPQDKKERFVSLQQRLGELSNKFSNNVLDATKGYLIKLTEEEASGLPDSSILLGRENAKKKNQEGLVFALDFPSYEALVTFANSRSLREKITIAYLTRASDKGSDQKYDNSQIIEEILKIRKELAEMLSFENFAEYSIANKAAESTKQVIDFLYDLAEKCRHKAQEELKELQEIAIEDGVNKIEPWDVSYYGEKLKQKKLQISQEELREYFPVPHVINGILDIIKRLYGVTLRENKNISVWHKDVECFEVYDHGNNLIGYLYLDLYYRDHKKGGAWMDQNAHKRYVAKDGTLKLPTTYLVCNFYPPIDDRPSMLTHAQLITLLHEMGHCLQYLLTKVNYLGISCIDGLPKDFVEIASQFMENWGWQRDSLTLLSRHYKTEEPLPKPMLAKLLNAKTFQSGLETLRQVEFSLTDFRLHQEKLTTVKELEKLIAGIQKQIKVFPVYKYERFLHYFLHLFSSDYEAGYYGYLWSNVISSDLFSRFEEEGILNQNLGREFLHIFLEPGSSEDLEILFKRFLGRDIQIGAFLRYNGMLKNALATNVHTISEKALLKEDL